MVVMDRSMSFGANAPLFSEIKNCCENVSSVIFGIGGKNIYEDDIKKIFDKALNNKLKNIEYIGARE